MIEPALIFGGVAVNKCASYVVFIHECECWMCSQDPGLREDSYLTVCLKEKQVARCTYSTLVAIDGPRMVRARPHRSLEIASSVIFGDISEVKALMS